jgi:signal peptidase
MTATAPGTRPLGTALRFAWRVLVWTVLLALVLVLVVAVLLPRVAGATPYTVLTGSMQPTYSPGTLVVVRPVAIDDVAVGDVITYQIESGEPAVVTHRVISVGARMNDPAERVLRTQGDANTVPDADPVREVQVQGRLWYSVPYLGHVGTWISGPSREVVTTGAVVVLLGYAAWQFRVAAAGRRRDRARRGAHAA